MCTKAVFEMNFHVFLVFDDIMIRFRFEDCDSDRLLTGISWLWLTLARNFQKKTDFSQCI